jgi:fructokinase
MTRPCVVSTGYSALDVVWHDGRIEHAAGGTAANVAANLSYLGWNAAVVALLGRDAAGGRVVSELRRAGVAVERIDRRDDVATPVVIHEITSPRHIFRFACPRCGRKLPRYRPYPQNAARRLFAGGEVPDVFFFDRASAAALAMAEKCRSDGGLVVFEPSAPGHADLVRRALEVAQLVKVSGERAARLDNGILAPRRGQVQVVTDREGARFRLPPGRWTLVTGYSVDVVDTGGAGDWMTAGLLNALPSLRPGEFTADALAIALSTAQALAALSCKFVGARGLAELSRERALAAARDLIREGTDEALAASRRRPSAASVGCRFCLGPTEDTLSRHQRDAEAAAG